MLLVHKFEAKLEFILILNFKTFGSSNFKNEWI